MAREVHIYYQNKMLGALRRREQKLIQWFIQYAPSLGLAP